MQSASNIGRWGFTFLYGDARISEEEKLKLIMEATQMYLDGEKRRRVSGENYKGLLRTEGNYQLLENFGGRRFDAELEIKRVKGKVTLAFLVTEHINHELN